MKTAQSPHVSMADGTKVLQHGYALYYYSEITLHIGALSGLSLQRLMYDNFLDADHNLLL